MPKFEVILPVSIKLKLEANNEDDAIEMAEETWYNAGRVNVTVPAGSEIYVREMDPGERLHHD
ncbi:MAG: hypothetical protein IBX61_07470 [Thermoleophilia bacterium]|nr:hypothetical protein [Thermoleophilia bacterium]